MTVQRLLRMFVVLIGVLVALLVIKLGTLLGLTLEQAEGLGVGTKFVKFSPHSSIKSQTSRKPSDLTPTSSTATSIRRESHCGN